jgi:pimeloyl-ACP methyl ester carboxylesterase
MGRSMGSVVAVDLAASQPPGCFAGLVLDSAVAAVREMPPWMQTLQTRAPALAAALGAGLADGGYVLTHPLRSREHC